MGWAPTVAGLISTVNPATVVAKEMKKLYSIGFSVSAVLLIGINKISPLAGLSTIGETQFFGGSFTMEDELRLVIEPLIEDSNILEGLGDSVENPKLLLLPLGSQGIEVNVACCALFSWD